MCLMCVCGCVFNVLCVFNLCVCQIREVLAASMRRVVEVVTGDAAQSQQLLNSRSVLTQHACYQSAVRRYKTACYNWHQTEVR